MKKVMLLMVALMVGVAMFAAGKQAWVNSYNAELQRLMLEKNYIAARAYVEDFDWTTSNYTKSTYVSISVRLDTGEKKPAATLADVKSQVAAYASKVGCVDQKMIDYIILSRAYASFEDKQIGYDFYKSLVAPIDTVKGLAINYCMALKKYDEALSLALAVGNYNQASAITATNLKDKVKTFEYAKKAMLDQYCTAGTLVQLLDRVGGFDYAETSVTKQMQSDLLQAVDLKYRRFLVKDKATWEPIIAGIRLTLQGYGVEVK